MSLEFLACERKEAAQDTRIQDILALLEDCGEHIEAFTETLYSHKASQT